MADSFGESFKQARLRTKRTLRAFCAEHGYDAGNISKIERGRAAPPTQESKLIEYATALGLKKKSVEWQEFLDLAAAERGRLPKDILDDAEVVAKLPALFRTIRGDKCSREELMDLIETIRRA